MFGGCVVCCVAGWLARVMGWVLGYWGVVVSGRVLGWVMVVMVVGVLGGFAVGSVKSIYKKSKKHTKIQKIQNQFKCFLKK